MTDIKQRITLDGAEDVAKKLKNIGDSGSDAFKKLKEFSDRGGESVAKFGKGADLFGDSHAQGEKLREVLHTLHPALDAAGLGLSNLGSYGRLAAAGLAPVGAALVGALLVDLAKLGEEIAKRKQDLSELARSKEAGENLHQGLRKNAEAIGTTESGSGSYVENMLRRRQKEDAEGGVIHTTGHPVTVGPLNDGSLVAAEKTLIERGIIGGQTAGDSKKFAGVFGQSLYQNDKLTPALIDQASPSMANYLSSLFGGPAETPEQFKIDLTKGRFQFGSDEINRRLAADAEPTQKAFEARPKYISDYEEQAKVAAVQTGRFLDKPISEYDYFKTPDIGKFLEKPQASSPPGELLKSALQRPDELGRAPSFDQIKVPEPKADTGNVGDDIRSSGDKTVAAITEQKSVLERILDAIAAAVSKPPEQPSGAAAALGVRGYTGGFLQMLAAGGPSGRISGPGGPKDDKVPAMLSDGEFVVNAAQTSKHLGLLHAINAGRYADGGSIGGDAAAAATGDWLSTGASDNGGQSPWKERDHWLDKHGIPFTGPDGSTRKLSVPDYLSAMQQQASGQAKANSWDAFEKSRNKWQKLHQFTASTGFAFGGGDSGEPQEPAGFAGGGLIGSLMGGGAGSSGGFDIGSMMDDLMPAKSSASSRIDSSMLEPSAGAVGAGLHPVTLDLGGRKVDGLFAHPNAFEQLQQEAILQQAIRTGIAPSSAR